MKLENHENDHDNRNYGYFLWFHLSRNYGKYDADADADGDRIVSLDSDGKNGQHRSVGDGQLCN